MRLGAWPVACAFVAAGALSPAFCRADPTLELREITQAVFEIRLTGLPAAGVAGYQVFLEFDPTRLSFVSAEYATDNFGIPFLYPPSAAGNRLSLAAGINALLGQMPSSADQTVATVRFAPVGTGCDSRLRVRPDSSPPTRLTDIDGNAILGLVLINHWAACAADFNRDGNLGVSDIFDFLNAWFAQSCRADFNNVGGLGVQDIFDFLGAWFSGC